jgi:hypothetical protein
MNNYKQINKTAGQLGLITTGVLILIFVLYLFYLLLNQQIKLSPETILTLLLLATIAIGIHSLQHSDQARNNDD